MGFKRKLCCLILVLMPLFLFTGCGDLEPEMQDTRTVILNMDFQKRSSSRSSSSVSASELSQYNTHLILALPSWEYLTSNYKNFYSSFAQGLMNTADKKVSLEIPLNTQMKIFAFLFKENYSMSELIFWQHILLATTENHKPFSIATQTNNLSLGITLQSTDTGTDTGDRWQALIQAQIQAQIQALIQALMDRILILILILILHIDIDTDTDSCQLIASTAANCNHLCLCQLYRAQSSVSAYLINITVTFSVRQWSPLISLHDRESGQAVEQSIPGQSSA